MYIYSICVEVSYVKSGGGFDVFLHRGELRIWVYVDEKYVFFCLNMWRNNVDICHNYMFKHVIMPMNKNVR